MSIFAGIFSRAGTDAVSSADRAQLRRAISRHPSDQITELRDSHTFLLKVDIGSHREPAVHSDTAGCVSLLAGEPLLALDGGDRWRSRAADLALLHEHWAAGDWDFTRQAQGVFCAAYYDPQEHQLSLVADKLCIRPLYYFVDGQRVVFATALRILEALSSLPKAMDVRAVTEMAAIGFPLGDRTPYVGVAMLRAAEVLHVRPGEVSHRPYWRWDEIEEAPHRPVAELARDAYKCFRRAVARRQRADTGAAAFLSGGLDSRMVVAALAERGAHVLTFNFSYSGSQDQAFAALFAKQVNTVHSELPKKTADPPWSMMMAEAWRTSRHRLAWPVERDGLIWSGDGGSVGIGFVYVYESTIVLLRAGRVDEAIRDFLTTKRAAVPRRLLRPALSKALAEVLHRGMREEIDDLHCVDPGRHLYLFLMLNDQRRHLAAHFEDIDLHRLEFQLPFYDGGLLAAIARVPVDHCVGHKFYSRWLESAPTSVTSVPWQAYPGHDPCPLPVPDDLISQWQPGLRRGARRRELAGQVADLLRAKDFPDEIIDRKQLLLATCLSNVGIRDYSYLMDAARKYHTYWRSCGGNYKLS